MVLTRENVGLNQRLEELKQNLATEMQELRRDLHTRTVERDAAVEECTALRNEVKCAVTDGAEAKNAEQRRLIAKANLSTMTADHSHTHAEVVASVTAEHEALKKQHQLLEKQHELVKMQLAESKVAQQRELQLRLEEHQDEVDGLKRDLSAMAAERGNTETCNCRIVWYCDRMWHCVRSESTSVGSDT